MRKLFFGLAVVIPLTWIGGMAIAGDFHSGDMLICSDCHTMHYSQQHGYNPDGGGFFTPLTDGGPFVYLLRNEENALCLTCHDGSSVAPDVLGQNAGKYPGIVREAGALNREDTGPYFHETGHTLGSIDDAPGSEPAWNNPDGLRCGDCHAVHGGNAAGINPYRNLGGFGTVAGSAFAISYAIGTNELDKDVFETAPRSYDISNVWFNEPDQTASKVAEFCKACHTNFHGDVGGGEIGGTGTPPEHFIRHPAAGVDIGAVGGGHSNEDVYRLGDDELGNKTNFVKTMGWNGNAAAVPPADGQYTPTCVTCHKGHGNQNAFGLIQMQETSTITEEGTAAGQYRDLCKQCHVQGG